MAFALLMLVLAFFWGSCVLIARWIRWAVERLGLKEARTWLCATCGVEVIPPFRWHVEGRCKYWDEQGPHPCSALDPVPHWTGRAREARERNKYYRARAEGQRRKEAEDRERAQAMIAGVLGGDIEPHGIRPGAVDPGYLGVDVRSGPGVDV